ncbi:phosphodiesterase [Marinobacter sp. R17]|uniref:putative bifunctional diguanylate cyclase/phosphodiesterase n=1 Tax=Marinobacter sp. R17 TaxID=2484250 RepID=UPI000F4D0D31|nr:GGDEF domain-containing phosphodiesterase [Marinobacter sp. R17]ROT99786.1 phosphodiesterase [Marinobacter sp. R17]
MTDSEKRLREEINAIADQLCQAIDGRFDFHVNSGSDDLDVQKLSVLSNFVLESVRRNLEALERTRDELEERVAERTRRLDLVIEGANDGVWEWDLETDSIQVSQRWLVQCGRPSLGARCEPDVWIDMIHPADRSDFRQALHDHINGLTARFRAEFRLSNGRGGYRWMVARGICDHDPQTGVARMISGTQADVTLQKFINPVTGFPNSQYLETILDERMRAQQSGHLDLVVLALPNYALVRETLNGRESGILAGELRRRMEECVRNGELIASLSDSTTAILINSPDPNAGLDRAGDVQRAFDRVFHVEKRSVWLSGVVGLMPVRETRLESADAVLQATRTLMRKARQQGSGSCLRYHDSMSRENLDRLETEQLLRNALRLGWVEPFLQPLVNLQAGRLSGFEVLARIRHPERGIIPPDQFIPVAEETGLIRELSERLLDQVIPLFNDPRLVEVYGNDFNLGVNLSPVQLHDPHLAESLLRRLSEAGMSPARFKVEMTETAVMADSRVAVKLMNELRDGGIGVALDDFGSGYSSLAYLRNLPLDYLKIDRSLVSGLDRDPEKRAILEMIISLCERLRLTVVVEGIENDLELSCLMGMGAMVGQGFLFSRPLPVDDLIASLPADGLLQPVVKPVSDGRQ